MTTTTTRSPAEQRMYDEGRADAAAGNKPTPPTMGGKLEAAYLSGYSAAPKSPPAKKAPAKSPAAKKAPATKKAPPRRAPARARARRRPPSYRRAARVVAKPVRAQIAGAGTFAVGAVGVAVLLNVLNHAQDFAGALGAVGRAVKWLDSPQPIPYRK